ncbi:hypothetical protein BC937DRAFT_93514 [Endogone sp. FLAS-F59071]|nr:hypothetical protein BC937DRAFT_93514 [Endogone sp. FLAS-F59071]|eukprot:RUS14644.1 hypothetical protein BC937DRAFT_93514 [Endogone sp. FLAS-F59071]
MSNSLYLIVYLEPSPASSFYKSLSTFLATSLTRFGPNGAHHYHPHCSMTGYFKVAPGGDDDLDLTSAKATLIGILDEQISARLPMPPPAIAGIISYKPGVLLVGLEAPEVYHAVVKKFAEASAETTEDHVREKRIDHISLAYGDLNDGVVEEMEQEARELLKREEEEAGVLEWDVVLYEVLSWSETAGVTHQFGELKRWRVTEGNSRVSA